ncbi:MAG: hypothetical protein AAGA03_19075, partial [Planctomycetota bacterium]
MDHQPHSTDRFPHRNSTGNARKPPKTRTMTAWTLICLLGTTVSAQEATPTIASDTPTSPNRFESSAKQRPQKAERRRRSREVQVKDPADFTKLSAKTLFSGPQSGETLPPLAVRGVAGDWDDKTIDLVQHVGSQPHLLMIQDGNGVGFRELFGMARIIRQLTEQSGKPIQMSCVFLADDAAAITAQVKRFADRLSQDVLLTVSPDGRDGPGVYGLNRNVSMTILVAKDGKVLHNFAFPQSMLYADPHVIGGVAEAIGASREVVAGWLNAPQDHTSREPRAMQRRVAMREGASMQMPGHATTQQSANQPRKRDWKVALERFLEKHPEVRAKIARGDATRADVIAYLKNRARGSYVQKTVNIKDPSLFYRSQEQRVFSGPQRDEMLPPLKIVALRGERSGETFDATSTVTGKRALLVFSDGSGVGVKGLHFLAPLLTKIT